MNVPVSVSVSVSELVSSYHSAAFLATFMPVSPSGIPQPNTTSSTSALSTPAFSIALLMA
jgi:hypothetical protein